MFKLIKIKSIINIYINRTGENSFIIVAPSTMKSCNKDGNECYSTNNYATCTCIPKFPSKWDWEPTEKENYISFSSAIGIIFTIFNSILILLMFYIIFIVLRSF